MRKASLGTIFLTVFIDLLGFGMVIPFLPGVARHLGASDLVASLTGSVYSLMQFLLVPVWGRLSDRIGELFIQSDAFRTRRATHNAASTSTAANTSITTSLRPYGLSSSRPRGQPILAPARSCNDPA